MVLSSDHEKGYFGKKCATSARDTEPSCVTCITWSSLGWLYTEGLNGVRSTVHLLTFHIKAPHYTLEISQPMCNYCRRWRKVTQHTRVFSFLVSVGAEWKIIEFQADVQRSLYICPPPHPSDNHVMCNNILGYVQTKEQLWEERHRLPCLLIHTLLLLLLSLVALTVHSPPLRVVVGCWEIVQI